MNVFVIPRSQTLRFVQIAQSSSGNIYYVNPQTMDSRLLMDEQWQTPEFKKQYLQKVDIQDNLLIQLTTNYDITKVTVNIYNIDGTVDPNLIVSYALIYSYTDGSGNCTYNFTIAQTYGVSTGFKYVRIISNDNTRPQTIFQSESFIIGNYSNLAYIQWQNSDRDGILWDNAGLTIFGIRAELRLTYSPSYEASIYEGFNFQPETLYSVSKRGIQIDSDTLPRFICEKLTLAFEHFDVWVNAVKVNSNGTSPKVEHTEYTNEYILSILVLETAYEDYSVLQEIAGNVISVNNDLIDRDNNVLTDADNVNISG
jgi:hypothetical protein